MSDLLLDVRLDGIDAPIGTLSRSVHADLSFTYDEEFLTNRNSGISLSLPLQHEPFGDFKTRAFFGNLLPERSETVQRLIDRERLDADDIAGLLFHLGADCPGAISVLPTGSPPAKVPGNLETDYDVLSDGEIEALAEALHHHRTLPDGLNDPSPIAGYQSKTTVTVLPNGKLAQSKAGLGVPTTHILKASGAGDRSKETLYEAAALELSKQAGIETADAQHFAVNGINLILVTRYDRYLTDEGLIARLHQEDFAQALGIPNRLKYEHKGEGFSAKAIGQLIRQSPDAVDMRRKILEATLFDLLAGNNDGHAKNFSFLYDLRGSYGLSPRYDIVPTKLLPGVSETFSYYLGGAQELSGLTAEHFSAFMNDIGISSPAAQKRLRDATLMRIVEALAPALEELQNSGMKALADLIADNGRFLADILGLDMPDEFQTRDAFVAKGGGWMLRS